MPPGFERGLFGARIRAPGASWFLQSVFPRAFGGQSPMTIPKKVPRTVTMPRPSTYGTFAHIGVVDL